MHILLKIHIVFPLVSVFTHRSKTIYKFLHMKLEYMEPLPLLSVEYIKTFFFRLDHDHSDYTFFVFYAIKYRAVKLKCSTK